MKFVAAMSVGVFFAMIGVNPIRGQPRFTFDSFYPDAGMNLVVVLIGVFAISQAFDFAVKDEKDRIKSATLGGSAMSGVRDVTENKLGILRGSLVRTFIGAGMSTVNSSKSPEEFGRGKSEGVIAAETSNNGSTMGALIPAMILAILGGAAAAVFIGVMLVYGITPGPQAFERSFPYIVIISIYLGDIVFLTFGLVASKYIAKIIKHPDDVLTGIITFALVRSFAMRNQIFDVGAAIIFGLIACVLWDRGYSMTAFILSFILGRIAESEFQRSLLISGGDGRSSLSQSSISLSSLH